MRFISILLACISIVSCNNISKKTGSKIMRKANKEIVGEAFEKAAQHEYSQKLLIKEIGDEFADNLVDYKQLKHRLLQKGYNEDLVNKLEGLPISQQLAMEMENLSVNEKTLKNLIDDVNVDPSFLRLLNQEPKIFVAYSKLSQTSNIYRLDYDRLRWLNNLRRHSTKVSNEQKLSNRYAIKNLRITEHDGVLYYYDGDQLLATETNRTFRVRTFPSASNNILNQTFCPNSTYIVDDRYIFKTDSRGRVIYAEADLILQKKGRDANLQAIGRDESGIRSGINAPYDDGGHIFSQEVGGPTELINIVPQLRTRNRGGDWRKIERRVVNVLKEGKTVKQVVNLQYSDGDFFARPTEYRITLIVDGIPEDYVIPNLV